MLLSWRATSVCRPSAMVQINGDGAENSRGQAGSGNRGRRQANEDPEGRDGGRSRGQAGSEAGTGDRRTRIQKGETGNVVGDRQGREAGTGDRRTRIQKDEAGERSRGQAGSGNREPEIGE
ncbi:unnamed protein product [Boreogadus saida]